MRDWYLTGKESQEQDVGKLKALALEALFEIDLDHKLSLITVFNVVKLEQELFQ